MAHDVHKVILKTIMTNLVIDHVPNIYKIASAVLVCVRANYTLMIVWKKFVIFFIIFFGLLLDFPAMYLAVFKLR